MLLSLVILSTALVTLICAAFSMFYDAIEYDKHIRRSEAYERQARIENEFHNAVWGQRIAAYNFERGRAYLVRRKMED